VSDVQQYAVIRFAAGYDGPIPRRLEGVWYGVGPVLPAQLQWGAGQHRADRTDRTERRSGDGAIATVYEVR
jgi:hypothetical protein